MKTVSMKEIQEAGIPDSSYYCSVLIEGLLEKGFCVTEPHPKSISEVVQALYGTMASEFGAQQMVALQTPQSQNPNDDPIYLARIAYVESGKSVAYIHIESIYSEVYRAGLSYVSMSLPIKDSLRGKSKNVISAAWPYIKELRQAPVSADKSCILQIMDGNVVFSGHDQVISGMLGINLPKKPLLVHPSSCKQP